MITNSSPVILKRTPYRLFVNVTPLEMSVECFKSLSNAGHALSLSIPFHSNPRLAECLKAHSADLLDI